MSRKLLITLSISFLYVSFLLAQKNILFERLTVEDGLSQSSVTCIFQDKTGFMWFGTQDGLNRYDGYTISVFKNDPSDSTTLAENFIFSIYENSSGELFIETQTRKFHQYDPLTESFLLINKETIDLSDARISTVGARLQESSGIVWTGGLSKAVGLTRTDTQSGEITVFRNDPNDPFSLSSDKVYSIYRDSLGDLWVGTFNGLNRFDEETGRFFHYQHEPDDPNSIPDNWVWPVFEDSRGFLWVGTVKAGLCLFDKESERFVNYRHDPNDPASISSNFIFSIYEDRNGGLWIGTNVGGVNYFHPSFNLFEHYKHNPDDKNSLSDNDVASMLASKNGTYWIGTSNGGLNRLDYKEKKFSTYRNDPKNAKSLSSNSIQSLLEDNSGTIWIGTLNNGLNTLNPRTGQILHYKHDPADPASLSDNRVYALGEDPTGNIWIGTYAGGLNMLKKSTGKIIRFQHNENDSTTLSSNAAWSLAFDKSGKLWVGTWKGGVNVFDPITRSFSHFRYSADDSASIQDDNIIRVFNDSKDNMWFGTTRGLSKYDRIEKKFQNYTEKDGLANSYVYGILEDDQGYLWLSTNNGLSRFNPEDESFRNYYAKDGLQGNEFNQNAFAKDVETGSLLFGGTNGFNIFNPLNITDNNYIPPISFTGYLRYNTDDEEGKAIVEKGISVRDSIFLTYKDNIIIFEFAALSYYNNLENQYRYKLEGFNENWIQLGNKHSVTFTNLSPDEYTLRVIGSNNAGIWNEEGATLSLIVSPPWWKTNIAYAIYFITFFGMLFSVRRFEMNRREQKAQIRESALRIKATEAEKRALQIENDRKTKELEEARQLQLSMLPKELPDLPDLEIAAFMRTATEVGGDYYDFLVQDNGELTVAFGDATGHGLKAGTMVTLIKGFFTADSSKLGLEDFMTYCSNIIKEIKLGRILMSFSYLKIHQKKLRITSGGMPPVFYHNKATNIVEEILVQGMPLGSMKNAKYSSFEKELQSGDTILLLTDGLPEQMNNKDEMFDYPRIKNLYSENIDLAPDTIIEKFITAGDEWMDGLQQDDDITLVIIRVK